MKSRILILMIFKLTGKFKLTGEFTAQTEEECFVTKPFSIEIPLKRMHLLQEMMKKKNVLLTADGQLSLLCRIEIYSSMVDIFWLYLFAVGNLGKRNNTHANAKRTTYNAYVCCFAKEHEVIKSTFVFYI